MLKVITLITKFIVITLIALLFGSCNLNGFKSINGSGNVTTEKRAVTGDFKNVIVSQALDLEIEQADKTEITVIADDNLQKEIITKIENGILTISCKAGNFNNVSSKKIIVKMPTIEGLEATSASTINSKNTLRGNSLSLSASSAASIHLMAEYESIQLTSGSASNLTIDGKALHEEASASSGSVINTSGLLANEVVANASSGATVTVSPILNLKADASSGGNIAYTKNPKSIQKSEHSGGNVHQE